MRYLFALAPLALVAACAGTDTMTTGSAQMPADQIIDMTSELAFSPNAITVDAGDTVEWRNISTFVHTVTTSADTPAEMQAARMPAGAAPFDSGAVAPGASYRQVFSIPGTYQYFCEPHVGQGMIGTVIVRP